MEELFLYTNQIKIIDNSKSMSRVVPGLISEYFYIKFSDHLNVDSKKFDKFEILNNDNVEKFGDLDAFDGIENLLKRDSKITYDKSNPKANAKTNAKSNAISDAKSNAKTNTISNAKTNAKSNAISNAKSNTISNATYTAISKVKNGVKTVPKTNSKANAKPCLYFSNLCLYKNMSFDEVKTVICSVLQINNITLRIIDSEYKLWDSLDPNSKMLYYKLYSIGNSEFECEINISASFSTIPLPENYINLTKYYSKFKVNKYKSISKIPINYEYITVSYIHDENVTINICDVFNSLKSYDNSLFNRIYLQYKKLDELNNEERSYEYIKAPKNINSVYSNIKPIFNACVCYLNIQIVSGIHLIRLEIYESGVINAVFGIMLPLNIDTIKAQVLEYCDVNKNNILETMLNIPDCFIDFNQTIVGYKPKITNISANITFKSDYSFGPSEEVFLQKTLVIKFSSISSIQFNGYYFHNYDSLIKVIYNQEIHEYLTDNITTRYIFPTIHISSGSNSTVHINFLNMNTDFDVKFNLFYIMMSFDNTSTKNIVDTSTQLTEESIRKKSLSYGKNLLKKLIALDPILFGKRKLGNKTINYSGLCQKYKQRVVPIVEEEYNILVKSVPDSVVKLKNQTYENTYLYLFCPYKEFSFINYRNYNNQKCLVKCTKKLSSSHQYNYCIDQLSAEKESSTYTYKYENQTITNYNPIIAYGRKCFLPYELSNLINYMLIKLDPEASTDIFNYCQEQYDKAPFIIQRDDSELNYKIITDYDQTRDYVLIIENEVNDDLFIVVNQDNKKPFIFSENPKFRDQLLLFLNNEHNTIAILNSVFKFDIDSSMSFNRVISMLLENNVSIVYNNRKIYGFIYNNILLSIPSIFYDTSDIKGKIELKKVIQNIKRYDFIDITELDIAKISELYENDGKIVMVKYMNSYIYIKPIDITIKFNRKELPIYKFDFEQYLFKLASIDISNDLYTPFKNNKVVSLRDFLNKILFVLYYKSMIKNSYDIDDILDVMQDLQIFHDDETKVVINKSNESVSIQQSKINIRDINKVRKYLSKDIEEFVFRYIAQTFTLKYDKSEEVLHKKIITI